MFISTHLDSATVPTHACKYQSKSEVLGSRQFGNPKMRDDFVYQSRLTLYTLHATRFVFDPGGLALELKPTHEDAREYEPKT